MSAPAPVETASPGGGVSLEMFGGRPVVCTRLEGPGGDPVPLTPVEGRHLTASAQLARERRVPLIWFISSSGTPADEDTTTLDAWGRAARELVRCSGIVPTICCVTGTAVAGPALLLGLVDIVVMVDESYAYVSGPRMVQQYTGVPIDNNALGGAALHGRTSGVATLLARDRTDAEQLIAEVLAMLPAHNDALAPRVATHDSPDRPVSDLGDIIPDTPTGSYDVREVVVELVDDGYFIEFRAPWATNLVTGLASIGGHVAGLVANQPQALAGTLDIVASQKGARFVSFCDAFNVPIVTLVDTPGFYPGKDLEWRGMIRHGAQMAFAYARATVPRVNLTLRKSYGGAYIVMDSKRMGNDLAMALPSAEIAVMGAKGAVEILHRRSDAGARAALEADYEARLLNPYRAADRGSIDAVIDPAASRRELAAALDALATKREHLVARRHDNSPL